MARPRPAATGQDQRRRQHHADDARQRGAAQRRRNIAAGDRGEHTTGQLRPRGQECGEASGRHRAAAPGTVPTGRIARPSSGRPRRVAARMIKCSRQCRIPASTAGRDTRAPWRKNSRTIAISLPIPTRRAASPLHGNTRASSTIARMASVKPSRRSHESLFIPSPLQPIGPKVYDRERRRIWPSRRSRHLVDDPFHIRGRKHPQRLRADIAQSAEAQ